MVELAGGVRELRLADLGNDLVDEADQTLDLLVCDHDRIVHIVVADLVCACFDHNDLLHGSGNRQLHVADLALFEGGVDNGLAVYHADEYAADRSVPRNIRDGERDGCADHACDLMRAVGIHCHNGQRDRNVVAQVLREQGTDGAVDYAGGEDRLFARSALSLEEAAGDLACCVHSLLEVYRQRQKVDAVAGLLGCGCARQHYGLAVANEAGAVCKTCELAGLDHERSACEGVLKNLVVFKHFHFLQIFKFLAERFST